MLRWCQMWLCGRLSDRARRRSLQEQEQPLLWLSLELVWRRRPSSSLFHTASSFWEHHTISFHSMVIFLLDEYGGYLVSRNRLYTITQYLLNKFLERCFTIFIGPNMLLKKRPKTYILRFTKTERVSDRAGTFIELQATKESWPLIFFCNFFFLNLQNINIRYVFKWETMKSLKI